MYFILVNSQKNGDISLFRRGIVRIYYSKEHKYLPLCWQQNNKMKSIADTVCRQLGFTKAQRYSIIMTLAVNYCTTKFYSYNSWPRQNRGLYRWYGSYINIESCGSDTLHVLRCVLSSPVVSVKCPNNRLLRINCSKHQLNAIYFCASFIHTILQQNNSMNMKAILG